MSSFGWLHVTDLHRGMSFQGCLWPNIEKQFFLDLEAMHTKSGPWHVLFFSGDLVQKGSFAEFKKFDETLTRLYKRLNALGSNPIFVAVPGNHDLVRPDPSDPSVKKLSEWSSDPSIASDFWTIADSDPRKLIRRAFRNYTKWESRRAFPKPVQTQKGMLPGDFSATVVCDTLKIGIVGLNTAFLQLTGGDYEGKLAVSVEQLRSVCGENFTDWFDQHSVSFLMTHHPPNWLDGRSQQEYAGELLVPGRFVAHLCGHMHEPLSIIQSIGGAADSRRWQGPALFGMELYKDRLERRHGYVSGRLDVSNQIGQLRLWPRLAQKHQAGHWHFIRETSATLESDEGTTRQAVPLNPIVPQVSSGKNLFRVLLLATDQDLSASRKAVADHLRKSLGVEVAESLSGELTRYNIVILIQGLWWDAGRVATVWKQTDPKSRVCFLSDESADWPPHHFVEIIAHEQVAAFRATVNNIAHKFPKPESLPEMVGAVVTERLQAHGGAHHSAGLRLWERSYLEFRIPAWRSGRTALSQPHLFDAADAKELYQPDLYTPLDGTAQMWHRGPDGQPVKSETKKRKKAEVEHAERRSRLAKWITVPQIPRIALVGAPGGGKTIFLTRIAAALGSACLGRAIEFEPDLDIERLRIDNSLPVPVVIEATRLAQQDSSKLVALLNVMADELASAGTYRPDVETIHSGLQEGRYFVLIDALDEIADSSRRSRTLTLLKGVGEVLPRARMLLTTRSARYTGRLRFGPELESIEVAPLDHAQIGQLCANWSRHRQRDDEYRGALMSAVSGLADKVGGHKDDQALTENPLMLTAICMVFERYRSLPDDRGRLCELLIEDLCRSRQSEDITLGWKLDESGKKDLLQRIALEMQSQGAQTWPFEQAIDIALQLVPKTDENPRDRAKRYVDWAADHTGILRFQDATEDQEQIRFWHRLFREYLSANRIAQEDSTADQKISKLWDEGRLTDPFWEDVIRLLPRALGTIEKARSFRQRLESLAKNNDGQRGRLLGLAAAGIIENRDLFPDVDFRQVGRAMAATYEAESEAWSTTDRLLFLDSVGRLDSASGDPRLHIERWVEPKPNNAFAMHHGVPPKHLELGYAWAPVAVQEFYTFIKSSEFLSEALWEDAIGRRPDRKDLIYSRIKEQMRHPNRPVVRVSFDEAIAYCRWKTGKRNDGRSVRLPLVSEWRKLMSAAGVKNLISQEGQMTFDNVPCNCQEAGLYHPSPVGAFPLRVCGMCDVIGNVWEWLIPDKMPDRQLIAEGAVDVSGSHIVAAVGGGSFGLRLSHVTRSQYVFAPDVFARDGNLSIGFRVVLTSDPVSVSTYLSSWREQVESMLKRIDGPEDS